MTTFRFSGTLGDDYFDFFYIWDSWRYFNLEAYGGYGSDFIFGSHGDDFISGGYGNDQLNGKNGNDVIVGDWGDDYLLGGEGNDQLYGGSDNDQLMGDAGADQLMGDAGADVLYGGLGNDYLQGGADNDILWGQEDNDILIGGVGIDNLRGGPGSDAFSLHHRGHGMWDNIVDFASNVDRVRLSNNLDSGLPGQLPNGIKGLVFIGGNFTGKQLSPQSFFKGPMSTGVPGDAAGIYVNTSNGHVRYKDSVSSSSFLIAQLNGTSDFLNITSNNFVYVS